MILSDLGAVFMLDRYPYHVLEISRKEFPEVFLHQKVEPGTQLLKVQVHELFRLLAEHIRGLSGEINRRLKSGIEPSEINKFISAQSSFVYEESKALIKINYLLVNNKLCRECFKQYKITEIGEEGICPRCEKEVEPASHLLTEFRDWLHSGGKRLAIDGLIIYIPA